MKQYVFDQKFTFENFIFNTKNSFPVLFAREFIERSGQDTNPFIISGESGSGKTHLLKAIANRYLQTNRDILLASPDELNGLLQETGDNGDHLQKTLSSFSVVMIDDFEMIHGHGKLTARLLPCIKQILQDNRQLIVTLSGKLIDLGSLPAEMSSRLQAGTLVELKKPDLDVRLLFLQEQTRKNNLELTANDLFEIATSCTDFQKLSGIMYSLLFFNEFADKKKDLHQMLTNKIKEVAREPSLHSIVAVVANHFDLSAKELISDKRGNSLVFARQMAMTLCRDLLGQTYAQIGLEFGGKNHSSALYSVKKIKRLQAENIETNSLFNALKKKCL